MAGVLDATHGQVLYAVIWTPHRHTKVAKAFLVISPRAIRWTESPSRVRRRWRWIPSLSPATVTASRSGSTPNVRVSPRTSCPSAAVFQLKVLTYSRQEQWCPCTCRRVEVSRGLNRVSGRSLKTPLKRQRRHVHTACRFGPRSRSLWPRQDGWPA